MSSSLIKTRVLIISDTHLAALEEPGTNGRVAAFQTPLPVADILIHCGDLTCYGTLDEFAEAVEMLREIEAPVKLVIAGNHDLSLDREYVLGHLDRKHIDQQQGQKTWEQARQLWTAPDGLAAQAGITFLDEGHHQIDLPNGSRLQVYASPYTPEFCDWGFPYRKDEDRFNDQASSLLGAKNIAMESVRSFSHNDDPIDIMITHGPPYGRLDRTMRRQLVGCPHLLRAVMRARPLIHCFGHIHEASGAQIVQWSNEADQIASKQSTIKAWIDGDWKGGIADDGNAIRTLTPDLDLAKSHHAVHINIFDAGEDHVKRGQDTLLVNAAIMNLGGRPLNPPCEHEHFYNAARSITNIDII
jgi:3',5'-cyclic AMP phosphodiesterase CpdA